MNEEEKKNQEQQLSPRRRTALVTYLAILFAVAFLFVAVMMVAETKRLKTMNQELQHDSQKNAATLTNNINALQEENQKLSKQNTELTVQIENLRVEASTQNGVLEQLREQLDAAVAEQEQLRGEVETLREETETEKQKALDAVRVSELLHQAMAADEDGDLEGLKELLSQIEPLEELLSDTEREIYEELKIA